MDCKDSKIEKENSYIGLPPCGSIRHAQVQDRQLTAVLKTGVAGRFNPSA